MSILSSFLTQITPPAEVVLSSEFFDIELKAVDPQRGKIWDDRDTGAKEDIAFWEVYPSQGFCTLGHYATLFHDIDPERGRSAPVAITLKAKPGFEDLLQPPIGLEKIWDDSGSGGSYGGCYIWRMKCPEGYVALGDIVTSTENPSVGSLRCIKKSALNAAKETVELVAKAEYLNLAEKGDTTLRAYWTDKGSGADDDVAIWLMKAGSSAPKKSQVYLVAGTFKASRFHENQPADSPYALVLNFPENDILEKLDIADKKVKLRGSFTPTEQEMKASEVSKEYTVPFFAVHDPNYENQLAQFRASPIYKIRRVTRYEVIDSYEPINTETKEFSITTGKSAESSYSHEVGVTLGLSVTAGGKAGVPLVAEGEVSVTASVEASYSHSWGGATSKYEERTFTYPQTVTGGCFGVLFQAKSTYTIYRADGTMVGAPVEVNTNEFYTDEWRPAHLTDKPSTEASAHKTASSNTITFTIEAPAGKTIILEGRLEIRDGQISSVPNVQIVSNVPLSSAPVGKAALFDAATPAMPLSCQLSNSYTKEAWIKIPVGNRGGYNIISGAENGQHAFWVNGRKVLAGHNKIWNSVQSNDAIAEGWEHYALTYDANTQEMKLYKNGKMVSSAKGIAPFVGGNFVQIGRWENGTAFIGEMAEARIWNYARKEEEIAAQMNAFVPKATAGLLAKYPE